MDYCNYRFNEDESLPINDISCQVELDISFDEVFYTVENGNSLNKDQVIQTFKTHLRSLHCKGLSLPCIVSGEHNVCLIEVSRVSNKEYQDKDKYDLVRVEYVAYKNKIPFKTCDILIISLIVVDENTKTQIIHCHP